MDGNVGLCKPFSEETLLVRLDLLLRHAIPPFGPPRTSQGQLGLFAVGV